MNYVQVELVANSKLKAKYLCKVFLSISSKSVIIIIQYDFEYD